MPNLYKHKDSNVRKTWFLITAFLLLVIGLGWLFSYVFQSQFILIFAIVLSFGMSFASYWWSDKLVIAMTRAKPMPDEGRYKEVHNIVENLAITAGLPKPDLYIMESAAPNAFATGRNQDKAVVAVTTGILEKLNRTELEGVLAHELSHIGNRDMLVNTVVVVLAGVIVYSTDILMRSFLWGGIGGKSNDNRAGAVMLVVGIVALLLAALVATLLKFAVSRKREYLADASGALLTRYPEGLASALEKISADTTRMRFASNATAHLFFENPFKADRKKRNGFVSRMFSTHPPVEERVKNLRGMEVE